MDPLPDAKVEMLKNLRSNGFSKRGTAEILDIKRNTVAEYDPEDGVKYENSNDYADKTWENIKPHVPDDVDPRRIVHKKFLPDDFDSSEPEGFGDDPYEDETDERLKVTDNPEDLTPGEFLESFFEEMEVGVKSKFINIQSRRADRRNELPDEDKMKADLKEMASGLKGEAANYVAEEYWAAAQDYIANTTAQVFRGGADSGPGTGRNRGGFVGVDGSQQQEGQWLTLPDGSRQYGRMVPDGQGGMRFEPMQPPVGQQPQPGMGGMGGQQMNPEVQQLREEIRELRRERQSGGSDDMMSEIQKFKELRDALNELQEENAAGADEGMRLLQKEIRAMREEMAGGGGAPTSDDPREAIFQRMLQNENVDEQTLMDALDRMEGSVDPEVKQMEKEMELEQKKMEQKKERQERVLGALEDIVSTGATAFAERLRQPDDGNPNEQQRQQQAAGQQMTTDGAGGQAPQQGMGQQGGNAPQHARQPTPGAGQQAEWWECPECGSETMQDPALDGKRCGECDFSRVPCPDCYSPVDIPPEDERPDGGCPQCGETVPMPTDMSVGASCLHCDWSGDAAEAASGTIECGECGSEHPITPDP